MNESFGFDIREDLWLAKVLGKPAFELICRGQDDEAENQIFSTPGFSFSKIPAEQPRLVEYLVQKNFLIASLDVTLDLAIPQLKEIKENTNVKVEIVQPDLEKEVLQIANGSFTHDRFHQDPLIDNVLADRIKSEWVGNYFKGLRGTHLFVAILENQVAGFLLMIVKEDTATIDLVGITKRFQNMGIGRTMISQALKQLDTVRCIVGTQATNYGSLSVYGALGFKVIRTNYSMHAHVATDL